MSVSGPSSYAFSRTVFFNPNGIRSEGIHCPSNLDYKKFIYMFSTTERESIRIAILDPSSWHYFDSNRNYQIAHLFPNLKEIVFVCAKPWNVDKYSKRRSALQFVPLRAGRYVQSGPCRNYLTERRSLRIERLIRKQNGKPLDTYDDDDDDDEERDEEKFGVGFLGDGDEKNEHDNEDPTDDAGQGENGFKYYSRWEDKRKEFEDMFHAAFTNSDGLLYHERDSDPRISIPKITFYGITELKD